tara:strand:+ start:4207 stop:4671 length:465 start_codon:yes stop_codon:yes gene_type:complete
MTKLVQKFLIPSILTFTLSGNEPAYAQDASKSFSFTTPDNTKINVPCGDISSQKQFLESLDSRIHGFETNMYALSVEDRKTKFKEKLGFMAESLKIRTVNNMLRPYQEYDDLRTDQEKIYWLEDRLSNNHKLSSRKTEQLKETCEALNPNLIAY